MNYLLDRKIQHIYRTKRPFIYLLYLYIWVGLQLSTPCLKTKINLKANSQHSRVLIQVSFQTSFGNNRSTNALLNNVFFNTVLIRYNQPIYWKLFLFGVFRSYFARGISLFTIPFHDLPKNCHIYTNDVFQWLFSLRDVIAIGPYGIFSDYLYNLWFILF